MGLGSPNSAVGVPVFRRAVPRGFARVGSVRSLGFALCLVALVIAERRAWRSGSRAMPLATVWDALTGAPVSTQERSVVLELRAPRTLIGHPRRRRIRAQRCAACRASRATRWPTRASSGISAGASLAAAAAVAAARRHLDLRAPIWFAFAGAAAGGLLGLHDRSDRRRGREPAQARDRGCGRDRRSCSSLPVADPDARPAHARRHALLARRLALRPRRRRRGPGVRRSSPRALLAAISCGPLRPAPLLGDDVARSQGVGASAARACSSAGTAVLLAGAVTAAAGPIVLVGLAHPARRARSSSVPTTAGSWPIRRCSGRSRCWPATRSGA